MYVVYSEEEARALPRMSKKELARLKDWQDPYDPDCPPSTAEQLKKFRRRYPLKTN